MNPLLRFFSGIRVFAVFIVLEIIAVILFIGNSYYQQSTILKSMHTTWSMVVRPVHSLTQYFSLGVVNRQLAEENNRLRNELEYLQSGLDSAAVTLVHDEEYRPLYSYIPAEIIDNSINKQQNYIMLNAGSEQGVTTEMGVITEQGVVGIVISVSKHYALVKSILNTEWKFNVRLKSSGDFGPMQWDGINYRQSILSDIPQHSNVVKGDTVVTSGYSRMFPQGIPVGVVDTAVIKRGNFYEVKVNLFIDLRKAQYVNIVNSIYRNELDSLKITER
ncbi:MAG: rod shape-determining protein MreC [Bacteroidales bacterium]|nr:rod shape-determining protein MreC [Bacteroidales bacterium]MCL2133349.1 rod shape-determining protein MreC [Bacteroidales bacterium]